MPRDLSEIVIDDLGNATDLRTGATVTDFIRNVGGPRYITIRDEGIYDSVVNVAPEIATAFSRGKTEEIFGFKVVPVQYLRETDKPSV